MHMVSRNTQQIWLFRAKFKIEFNMLMLVNSNNPTLVYVYIVQIFSRNREFLLIPCARVTEGEI